MPRIKVYRSKFSVERIMGAQASPKMAQRPAFTSGVGEALGYGAKVASNVGTFLDDKAKRDDVSNLHSMLQSARVEWTGNALNRAKTEEGSSPGFVGSFSNDLNSFLAKGAEHATTPAGKRYWAEKSAQLHSDLTIRVIGLNASSIAERGRERYNNGLNDSANTLLLDPTQHSTILDNQIKLLADPDGIFSNLPANLKGELEESTRRLLAKAAVRGGIRKDPAAERDALEEGVWNSELGNEAIKLLIGEARQAENANQAEAEKAKRRLKEAQEKEDDATRDTFLKALGDAENPLTWQQVQDSNLPAFGSGSKNTFRKILVTEYSPLARTDSSLFLSIRERMTDPPPSNPEAKFIENKLTTSEHNLRNYHLDSQDFIGGASPYYHEDGTKTTVLVESIRLWPQSEKHVNVPAYINTQGRIIKDHDELIAHWREKIESGFWPTYASGEEADAAAKSLHTVIEADAQAFDHQMPTLKEIASYIGEGFTVADYNSLKGILDNLTTGDKMLEKGVSSFLKRMKGTITESTIMGRDASGDQSFYEFEMWVRDRIKSYIDQKKDPYLLLHPDKPEYLGNMAELFRKSDHEKLQDTTKAAASLSESPVPPKREGETTNEWVMRAYAQKKINSITK
jgi:hypothetical protein